MMHSFLTLGNPKLRHVYMFVLTIYLVLPSGEQSNYAWKNANVLLVRFSVFMPMSAFLCCATFILKEKGRGSGCCPDLLFHQQLALSVSGVLLGLRKVAEELQQKRQISNLYFMTLFVHYI